MSFVPGSGRRPRLKLITIPWNLEVATLGLASLAAVTPDCFEIAIVDLLRERLNFDEEVDLVGITASTPRIKAAYALADLYRARGVTVVIGGHHATAMPEEALNHADAVVCGEGETSWIRICDEFLSNPARVAGVYRDPPPDTATLPQPRIDLMKIERYGVFSYPVIASRGCPEVCSFCFAKRMTHGYRTYPISHVIEQVRRRPAFIRSMYFVDDNLPGDLDYVRELFKELARYKVPWGMQARNEFALNPDDLNLAREAGCILISSGYESVNQMTLNRTGKQASATAYQDVAANIFDAGIIPSGNWMLGFDWDGPGIFDETLAFLDQSKLLHCNFTCEIPFPGTTAYRKYAAEGRLLSQDYDDYTGKDRVLVRPKQMTPEALQTGIRSLALRFYSPRRALRRGRLAMGNARIADEWSGLTRGAALAFLNLYQVYQWHHRMIPSINWLYQRMVSINKYRYFRDYLRGTNFWSSDLVSAEDHHGYEPASYDTSSPFLHAGGSKPHGRHPLAPICLAAEA